MDFHASTLWWGLAGLLVLAELLTGTFYLLILALGASAAALAAHAGGGLTAQLVAAAAMGGGGTALWHLRRAKAPRSAPAASNADVNLDIGQTVNVTQWDATRQAKVHYRGAAWGVRYAGEGTPAPGEHVIVAVHGNRLDVRPAAPTGTV